jgi:hypothetical protein
MLFAKVSVQGSKRPHLANIDTLTGCNKAAVRPA